MVHQAQGQLVQEVATGGLQAPPSRYVLREKDRPTTNGGGAAAPPELGVFPTVDVGRLAEPGDVEEAAKLQAALQSWGLFAVRNVTGHGIPAALLDGIHKVATEFFHMPSEEKLKCANKTDTGEFQNQGYGIDRVDTDEQVLDWCDRLYLQVQPEEARQPRFWPKHPPSLAKLLHEYSLRSEQVAKQVLKAMARALGFADDFFLGRHVGEDMVSWARFTYYPPCPRPDLVAPKHRVVASERERMSLVIFYLPEEERDMEPAEELVGEARPALYKKLNVKTFTDGFWDAFALGEPTIDFLNVRVDDKEATTAVSAA
ncbi:hypothetical protein HU200_035567 [Digitaria exilis]|uniref:Non-haem dioxygenase N-terminal domain-containing protein n=1 Tax=Digitaria exilis TaxID=1010633 RepID=A0A835EPJ6_9POAL|nr:hypothetical protein HU200_035567 [Digitaria exilis]